MYHRMTFGTFMAVCMQEYTPVLPPEGAICHMYLQYNWTWPWVVAFLSVVYLIWFLLFIIDLLLFLFIYIRPTSYFSESVAVAWSAVFLPSKPVARIPFPAGSGILIYIMGLGMCPFPVSSLAVDLTFCWSQIQGDPPSCSCIIFWSLVWLQLQASDQRHWGIMRGF